MILWEISLEPNLEIDAAVCAAKLVAALRRLHYWLIEYGFEK